MCQPKLNPVLSPVLYGMQNQETTEETRSWETYHLAWIHYKSTSGPYGHVK